MEQKNPMVVVYTLFASAALFATLGLLAWFGVIDLGIEPTRLAMLCGLVMLADIAVATMFLLRAARRR